ncbi:MAG: hypothetical protein ABI652_07180 [Acidobacteriota bacterium]
MNSKKMCTALTLASVFAVGMTVSAQSQTPSQATPATPSTPTNQTTPNTQAPGAPRTVTMTGCVQQDTTAPAGGGAAADATRPAAMYKLTMVEPMAGMNMPAGAPNPGGRAGGARPATDAAATATPPSRAGQMMAAMEYRLMPTAGVDLSAHVNHKMEVTGTMAGPGMGAGNRGGNMAPANAPANAGGRAGAPETGAPANGDATPKGGAMPKSGSTASGNMNQGAMNGPNMMTPMLSVTSVKMIAATCN